MLKAELSRRGLDTSGLKAALVARLEAADATGMAAADDAAQNGGGGNKRRREPAPAPAVARSSRRS